jgi:hypothetical protein
MQVPNVEVASAQFVIVTFFSGLGTFHWGGRWVFCGIWTTPALDEQYIPCLCGEQLRPLVRQLRAQFSIPPPS